MYMTWANIELFPDDHFRVKDSIKHLSYTVEVTVDCLLILQDEFDSLKDRHKSEAETSLSQQHGVLDSLQALVVGLEQTTQLAFTEAEASTTCITVNKAHDLAVQAQQVSSGSDELQGVTT